MKNVKCKLLLIVVVVAVLCTYMLQIVIVQLSNGNYLEQHLEEEKSLLDTRETITEQLKLYFESVNSNTTSNVSSEHTKMSDKIFSNKNRYHVTSLVTDTKCKYHYKVLIMILSYATNFKRRETIRNTWGSDHLMSSPRWKTVFLVGRSQVQEYSKQVFYEIQKYEDIILGDVIENESTYKVQMGCEWAVKYCSFDLLFKGHDDVFINVPRLFSYLERDDIPTKGLYIGNVHFKAKVKRTGRYAVTKEEYSKSLYPRYSSGGGFLLSKDVVKAYIPLFKSVSSFRIDDAYFGLLALKVGMEVIHSDEFKMTLDENKCIFHKNLVVYHPVKTEQCMKRLFSENILAKKTMV